MSLHCFNEGLIFHSSLHYFQIFRTLCIFHGGDHVIRPFGLFLEVRVHTHIAHERNFADLQQFALFSDFRTLWYVLGVWPFLTLLVQWFLRPLEEGIWRPLRPLEEGIWQPLPLFAQLFWHTGLLQVLVIFSLPNWVICVRPLPLPHLVVLTLWIDICQHFCLAHSCARHLRQ